MKTAFTNMLKDIMENIRMDKLWPTRWLIIFIKFTGKQLSYANCLGLHLPEISGLEYSSCDRDHMVSNLKIITLWPFKQLLLDSLKK